MTALIIELFAAFVAGVVLTRLYYADVFTELEALRSVLRKEVISAARKAKQQLKDDLDSASKKLE